MNVPRVKRERRRRGQAQLPWQESTWVQSFAGDAPSPIKVSDLNPGFALRQIVLLMEKRKFDDCSQLVNQMNQLTLKTIMPEMPVDVFIEEIPYSLVILESLFSKLFIADPDSFPVITLKVENILLRIVRFLARQEDPNAQKFSKIDQADKAIASILRIIAFVEPEIMKTLRSRKRMMETVLEGMGGHGLVSIDNSLMTLHDALKLEFEQNIIAYKAALQKLEDLSLSHSKPMTLKNISTGSARTAAPSHHKLMKVNQDQIQVRLYKNKSLLNVVEPSMRSKLPNLLQFLQDCIENDKGALLAFGQLRKEIKTIPQDVKVAPIIAQYTRGLRKVLEIFKRVSDENPTDMMNMPGDGYHSDEDTVLTIEHTLHSQDESDQLCVDSGISSGTQSPDKTSSDAGDIATTSKNGSDMEVITLGQGKDIRRKQERGRQRNKEKSRRGRSKERRSVSIDRDDIKHSITRPRRNSVEESTELRVMIDRINKMAAATGQRSRSRSCSRDRSEPHPPARKHLKSAKEWLWSDLNLTGEVENQRDGSSADSQSNNSVEINGSSMNGRVSPMEVKIFKSSREKLFSDEIERLKTELAKCKDTIQLLQQREKQLMTRLSDTSQRHLYRKASEQPAVDLINAYTKLYTESRQDALDVLDVMSDLNQFDDTDDIKSKLLFSVIVLAFRFSQNEIEEMMSKVIEAVNIPNTGVSAQISTHSVYVKEMECLTTNYLYRTAKQYDLNNVIEKVSEQLFSTLHDYPSLRMSSGIKSFIGTCVRVAWQLSTHSPPYILDYDHKDFNDQLHQRFHRNDTNKKIKGYLWPALLDATTLKCVHKGVVITEKSESDDELCDTKL